MHGVHTEQFIKMSGSFMHISREIVLFGCNLIGEEHAISLCGNAHAREKGDNNEQDVNGEKS